jgi:DNA-binding cell septation regulator SpoVG
MSIPTKVEFVFRKHGKVEAFADVHYGDFVMKGFRVMQSANGGEPWIGMPSKQIKGRDGEEGEWITMVWMPDAGRRKAFERFVLDAYARELREREATSAA